MFEQEGGGTAKQATWTPCAFTLQKMSILSLYNGLDYIINWCIYVIMCVFHCGISVYYGDFIFTGHRVYLSNGNMSTIMFIMEFYMLGLCNISWNCKS